MPKEMTHWILAQATACELGSDSRLAGIIRKHRSAYLGGAVLPDTLLHLFRGPYARPALKLAHDFHDAYGNSFAPLIRVEANHAGGLPDDLLACLLGVASHMLADIVFHPFVFALSGTHDIGQHYRMETALDVHFLRRGTIPPVRRLTEVVTSETRAALIKTAGMLFDPGKELPEQALEQALALHCRFQGMYDRTGWKIAALILGHLCGSPFREQRHLFYPLGESGNEYVDYLGGVTEWNHPVSGDLISSSIDDLARETLQRSVAIFSSIEERGSLAAALSDCPGANLLTGLHGIGNSEMERASRT
jgi:hypothetical protein